MNFKSPESAYKYCTGKSNINLVVEGNTCDLVVSQKDHSYSNLIVPKTEDGQVDFSQDFFGKSAHLTVSGQLNAETFAQSFCKNR